MKLLLQFWNEDGFDKFMSIKGGFMQEEQESINLMHLNKDYLDLYFSDVVKYGLRRKNFNIWVQVKEGLKFIYYGQVRELISRLKIKYMIHDKNPVELALEPEEYFKENSNRNYTGDYKVVVYTAVFGKTISINQPVYCNPKYDYYIFTDQVLDQNSKWKSIDIRPYEKYLVNLDYAAKNRWFKLHPHLLFPDYDYSVYLDGSIILISDVMPMVCSMKNKILATHKLKAPVSCVYESAKSVLHANKAPKKLVKEQMEYYRRQGYPKNNGMFENGFLIRKHNDDMCKKIMVDWWKEMETFTMRDQLSLNYVLWKNNIQTENILVLGINIYKNPRFRFSNLRV